MRMQVIDTATHHPVAAGFVSLLTFIFGHLVKPVMAGIHDVHIPPVIMELLQALAWVVAIAAGSISIYGFFRNLIKRKERS